MTKKEMKYYFRKKNLPKNKKMKVQKPCKYRADEPKSPVVGDEKCTQNCVCFV